MADKDTRLVKAEIGVNYSLTFKEVQGFETQPFSRTWGSNSEGSGNHVSAESMPGSPREHLAASSILTNPCRSNLDLTHILLASSAIQLKDSKLIVFQGSSQSIANTINLRSRKKDSDYSLSLYAQ